jgi:ABC-type branched-subunit amino acid transport system permease subunit
MFFIFVGGRAVIVGVGCGVMVVVGGVVVFSELERDEQGMGVLTWYTKIQNNDERRTTFLVVWLPRCCRRRGTWIL